VDEAAIKTRRPRFVLQERPWLNRQRAIALSYVVALILYVVTGIYSPGFLSLNHLRILAVSASILGIVAAGQTLVILTGGIDLSVSSVLTASAIVTTLHSSSDQDLWHVLPLVFLMAAGVGLINGVAVSALHLPAIIVTLGTAGVLQGALLVSTSGGQTGAALPPAALTYLADGDVGPIPTSLLCWILLTWLVSTLLSRMPFGRKVYAIGNGPIVARMTGVNIVFTLSVVYVFSALCAAFAGLLLAGDLGTTYLSMGDTYLFTSISAVLIGGASILGGRGHYLGTVAGVIILTGIGGLLAILNQGPATLAIIYGVIILVTVGVATAAQRGVRR